MWDLNRYLCINFDSAKTKPCHAVARSRRVEGSILNYGTNQRFFLRQNDKAKSAKTKPCHAVARSRRVEGSILNYGTNQRFFLRQNDKVKTSVRIRKQTERIRLKNINPLIPILCVSVQLARSPQGLRS
jgi:hypothetical protein